MAGSSVLRKGVLAVALVGACAAVFFCLESRTRNGPERRPAEPRPDAPQNTLTREELLVQLAANESASRADSDLLRWVREMRKVNILRLPTPLFRRTALYRVLGWTGEHFEPGFFLLLKTSDGQIAPFRRREWTDLLRREGISITSAGDAAALFRAYATPGGWLYLVEKFEDIPFMIILKGRGAERLQAAGIDPEPERKEQAKWRKKLAPVIRPLTFRRRRDCFESVFFSLEGAKRPHRGMSLARGICRVHTSGKMEIEWKDVVGEGVIPDLVTETMATKFEVDFIRSGRSRKRGKPDEARRRGS